MTVDDKITELTGAGTITTGQAAALRRIIGRWPDGLGATYVGHNAVAGVYTIRGSIPGPVYDLIIDTTDEAVSLNVERVP